ncbi:5206_t:CDS:2, partial [Ambispora leptoticha]
GSEGSASLNGSTHIDDITRVHVSESSSLSPTFSQKRIQIKSNDIPSASSSIASSSPSSPLSSTFSHTRIQNKSNGIPSVPSSPSSTIRQRSVSPRPQSPSLLAQAVKDSPKSPIPQKSQDRVPIKHRHSDLVHKALTTLKKYGESLDGWEFYSENKGVKIYMKEVPGKTMPIMRGEATITGGWTVDDLLATILDPSCRKIWDDRLEDGMILERLNDADVLVKTMMKGTFPISGRDLSTAVTTERDPFSGAIYNAGCSVIDPAIPETNKHVRAQLDLAGWILRPHFDFAGFTSAVDVTYIVDIDIKLQSIPSTILKTISTGTPMCIARIDELIQKNGYPPYVRNTNGKVVSSAFNLKNCQYELTLSDLNPGAITEICASRKMYPSGFDISIKPEGSKVELLANNTEVVRITMPEKASYKTLSIVLTKQASKEAQLTLNGKQSIPVVPSSNLPGQFNSIRSSRTFGKMAANLRSTTPTTSSNNIGKNINNNLVVNQPPPNPLNWYNKEGSNDTENQSVNMPAVRNSTIKKDVVVLSDTLRFNSHQVGLMFTSMLLAYYAGKLSGC